MVRYSEDREWMDTFEAGNKRNKIYYMTGIDMGVRSCNAVFEEINEW